MKKLSRIVCAFLVVALLPLGLIGTSSAAQNAAIPTPAGGIATAGNGSGAIAAVKDDGRLYTRLWDANGTFGAWQLHDTATFASVDIDMVDNGTIVLVATKQDGSLFTRQYVPGNGWAALIQHEGTFAVDAAPSISIDGTQVLVTAVLATRDLITRTSSTSGATWDDVVFHGLPTWQASDGAILSDGTFWFIGTKQDGRLYTRKYDAVNGWDDFLQHGLPTWATDAAPAITARTQGASFAAIKATGRLYIRDLPIDGAPLAWLFLGLDTWSSVDIAAAGQVWIAATKQDGRLYTNNRDSDVWQTWQLHGLPTWDVNGQASIDVAGTNAAFLGIKEAGNAWTRTLPATGPSDWFQHGLPTWAVAASPA